MMILKPPRGCADCPIGRASGVGRGSYCAFVDRQRRTGEILYLQGAEVDHAWFIKRGTVVLYRDRAGDGEPAVHAVRFAGALIGLETLVAPRYADTARAVTEVTVCGIPRAGLDQWLGPKDTPARTALEVWLRAGHADRLHRSPRDGSAVARVADWLAREGTPGVSLSLPRQIVAELLGMRPETLSRAIAALRDRGAIAADRSHIEITDEARLQAAARES